MLTFPTDAFPPFAKPKAKPEPMFRDVALNDWMHNQSTPLRHTKKQKSLNEIARLLLLTD